MYKHGRRPGLGFGGGTKNCYAEILRAEFSNYGFIRNFNLSSQKNLMTFISSFGTCFHLLGRSLLCFDKTHNVSGQNVFPKYWGTDTWAAHNLKLWGDRPPRSLSVSAPVYKHSDNLKGTVRLVDSQTLLP